MTAREGNMGNCQVNIWVCISYSVNSNAHTTPVRIYGEPYAHKFCAVDIFWNITRRQAILPVAKFHYVLGRGFMIKRVILYKYWLHERVTWEIVTPRKPMSTEAKPRLTLVFEGWQFPMLPSRAVNNYYIILNVNYITFGFKTIRSSENLS